MFDAKSLIEAMMGGGQRQGQGQGGGGLGDLLGQVLGGAQQQGGRPEQGGPQGGGGLEELLRGLAGGGQQGGGGRDQGGGPGAGLEDLLKNFTGGQQGGGQPDQGGGGLGDLLRNIAPGAPASHAAPQDGGGGGLGDLLGKLQQSAGGQGQGQGGIMDILGQILGQAGQGVKEGAQRFDDATGASQRVGEATGQAPADLIEKLKALIADNKLAAGAAMGGLGGLLLGTKSGRSVAATAAKVGGLVLIGGLAYKAYQNYSAGKPVLGGGRGGPQQMAFSGPAPQGSGFEPGAISNESATLYIRAMIAAAASDGELDQKEYDKILGGLKQAGVEAEARAFVENELQNPATVEDLAAGVQSAEEAVQVYTAARLAVDVDTQEESEFLARLAQQLNLDSGLVAHIEASAREIANA